VRVDIVTIFPDYLAPLDLSLVGKARRAGLIDVYVHDLREWTSDVHRTVDDTPYGGGAGMVMRPEPWGLALDSLLADGPPEGVTLIVPTPAGRPFTQATAEDWAGRDRLLFACGRYEGIDARVAAQAAERPAVGAVEEVSLGDYVLAGGEVAALVMVEAVTRLLPGVLGNPGSLDEESHMAGLLEYPVWTKPQEWRGLAVPEVLRSGDHAAIARWRRNAALQRTAATRPDLLARLPVGDCDATDLVTLADLGWRPGPDGRFHPDGAAVAD
jgi:tRNA (guanine37-N1)-methyltransferase